MKNDLIYKKKFILIFIWYFFIVWNCRKVLSSNCHYVTMSLCHYVTMSLYHSPTIYHIPYTILHRLPFSYHINSFSTISSIRGRNRWQFDIPVAKNTLYIRGRNRWQFDIPVTKKIAKYLENKKKPKCISLYKF